MDDLAQGSIDAALNCEWKKAILLNLQILKSNPKNIDALSRLCKAYIEIENIHEAKSILGKIFKLDPYNLIAQKLSRRCKKIKRYNIDKSSHAPVNIFIEEPGKTKVAKLIHLGSKEILESMDSGDKVEINPQGHRITISYGGRYMGKLTDDISTHIKRLISMNFSFEACVKCIGESGVKIIIREISKPKKYSHLSSFPSEKVTYLSYTPPEFVHSKTKDGTSLETPSSPKNISLEIS